MAATLSREDLKLEQLIHVESVQVDGEDWEIGYPPSFCQDTVWGQEKQQYHSRTTYLGSDSELSPVLESLDIGELSPPSEKTLLGSVVVVPVASEDHRHWPKCVRNGTCGGSAIGNYIVKERYIDRQITGAFYTSVAAGCSPEKPTVDLFVLSRSRASAEISRAFQALERLEYPDGVLVVHILDATNSLLAESLAQRNDFDYVRVEGQHVRLHDLEWAFELAQGDVVIAVDLDLCSSVNDLLQTSSMVLPPCNSL
ncbi:hypothetical protein NU219Hw_g1588t2 [Hortaea werneckii]